MGDFITNGTLGLFHAIERYEPWKNVRFEQYCIQRIKGAMIDGLRNEDVVPRLSRRRMKLIDQKTEELRQRGVLRPKGEEILALVGMTAEAFEGARQLQEAIRIPDGTEVPVEFQKDARSSEPDTFELFRQVLGLARKRLFKVQFRILMMYYGEGIPFREIGKALKLSESRICQLHQKAIFSLRTNFKREDLA